MNISSNAVARVQNSLVKPVWAIRPGMIRGLHFRPDGGEDNTPGGDSDGEPDEPEDEGNKPVSLTVKQQQDLIAKRERAATDRANKANAATLKELQDKIAAFEKNSKPEKKENTYTQDDLQKILDERDRTHGEKTKDFETRLSALQNAKKDSAIISAATKAKCIDADMILPHISRFVSIDDEGQIAIVDASGNARLSKRGNEMTLEDLVDEFLSDKPYLRQGSGTGGTGSSTTNGKTPGVDIQKLALTDPAAALKYLNDNAR